LTEEVVMKDITITFDADGTPSASPDPCTVAKGTKITLQTNPGVDTTFDIAFQDQSPAGPQAPKHLSSKKEDSRQKVKLTADNAAATYQYSITVNGIPVDPAIIIQ
jgi:hypothetical protein